MKAAACVMARGRQSSFFTRLAASASTQLEPSESLVWSKRTASCSASSGTGVHRFRSARRSPTRPSLVVTITFPFGLLGRYADKATRLLVVDGISAEVV